MSRKLQECPNSQDEILTPQGAASFLKVTVPSIYQRVARRELSYIKMGRLLRFKKSDLQAYIDSCVRAGRLE